MPTISKVRFTNVQYEGGNKRYQDELFLFDGHNGAILLENGGGKTVFIQTVIQAILPNSVLAGRKMRDTLDVTSGPAHIAVEWILEESPREYAVTCITFFMSKDGLSYELFCNEYRENSPHSIERIPFVQETLKGMRVSNKEEIFDYYQRMERDHGTAQRFDTIKAYHKYLEDQYRIVPTEWEAMLKINSTEGGVDAFFDGCKTMTQLVDKLLIPTAEQGLAVQGVKDFAELFDNHRDHFREYVALGEHLQEVRKIDEDLQELVLLYKAYDEEERAYRKLQGKGKTLWLQLAEEKDRLQQLVTALTEEVADLDEERKRWEQRKDGFEVWKKTLRASEAEAELALNEPLFVQAEEAERRAQTRYRSLQHLLHRQEEAEILDRIRLLQEQLQRMEQEVSASDLEQQLETSLRQAAYLFDQKLQRLERDQQQAKQELQLCEAQLHGLKHKLQGVREMQVEQLTGQSKYQERLASIRRSMEDIESEILFNKQKDQVPQELVKWQTEITQVEKSKFETVTEQKRCADSLITLKGQVQRANQELLQAQQDRNVAQTWLKFFTDEEKKMAHDLEQRFPEFANLQSLHLKEESIRYQLDTQVALLDKKIKDSFDAERIAYRFFDLYKDNQVFTADPELERWVEREQLEFPSMELGTTYALRGAQEQGESLDNLYRRYPLWPMTLVVIGSDLEKVKQRLLNVRRQWTHPVHLITTTQARAYLQGEWNKSSLLITPDQWLHLNDVESFKSWLDEQQAQAREASANRNRFEQERQVMAEIAGRVSRFFETYPRELVKVWRDKLEIASRSVNSAERLLDQLQVDLEEQEDEQRRLADLITQFEQRSQNLSTRIEKAHRWQSFATQGKQTQAQLEQIDVVLELLRNDFVQLNQEIEAKQNEVNKYRAETTNLEVELKTWRGRDLYQRVFGKERQETQESLLAVQVRIGELDVQLAGIVHEKRERERALQELQTRLENHKTTMQTFLNENQKYVDLQVTYAGNVQEAIQIEQAAWQQLSEQWKQAKKHHESLQKKVTETRAVARIAVDEYEHKYEQALHDFGDQTEKAVAEELKEQQNSIRERLTACETLMVDTKAMQESNDQVYSKLNLLSDKQVHGFAEPNLSAVSLSDEEEQRFPYERLKFVQKLGHELDSQAERVKAQGKTIAQRRERFQRELEHVRDERIRQRTLDGLALKRTYAEIQEWANLVHERLYQVMSIAEEQQRAHDEQVQHVIHHLHSHVVNICRELKEIPRMTRVRFESGPKEIFDFTIPEWNEEEGLLQIRRHLEALMKELEKETYKLSTGQEDKEKVRKRVEEWLHPTTLLQKVNSNENILVRCRKVTNDKLVAERYTPWPETENWSGGEKWSKNMTLMLGILNYLAEKRGHLRPGKANHRAVICDNPFGKASSDHVLGPVFHIAKQLGFQVVALTAHAEGKFLRDYFPVLYSCRLRPTKDPSIQVMQAEKKIHLAFFRDHAPQSLDRLGEEEQLTMLM